jgi:predicted nucleic acid-binding protein
MKKAFLEYNPVSKEIIKELWDNAIFVFDSNVLLNLYRYSDKTSQKFLETIINLKNRIWVPFQVGLEFSKNRLSVICDQKKSYEDFEKKLII